MRQLGRLLSSAPPANVSVIDRSIAAANAAAAQLVAEADSLRREVIRIEQIITAHNAIQGTPEWRAEHARLKAQRDEIERRCTDLIGSELRPMEKRLATLNGLRASTSATSARRSLLFTRG
jgi:hypothetical protein